MREVCVAVADRARDGTISLRKDRVLHADVALSRALKDLVRNAEGRSARGNVILCSIHR